MRLFLDVGKYSTIFKFAGWDSLSEKILVIYKAGAIYDVNGSEPRAWKYELYGGFDVKKAKAVLNSIYSNVPQNDIRNLLVSNVSLKQGEATHSRGEPPELSGLKSFKIDVDHNFSQNCSTYWELGIDDFIVDGISSWDSSKTEVEFNPPITNFGRTYAW